MTTGRTRNQNISVGLALFVGATWIVWGVVSAQIWQGLLGAFWLVYGLIGLLRPQWMWGSPEK